MLTTLRAIVGEGNVLVDEDTRETYGRDWTRFHAVDAAMVVFPRSADEVAKVLAACHEGELAVVPSGGRTGLAAGAVATRGEVILSLDKLNTIEPVDALGATVRVGAGAITAAVHAHVEAAGFIWPIDLAAKGTSQIGGNISTNAGGVRVIRYGPTRKWVLGLTVALMDGRVLELGGALEKDNTGYDLKQLFIGAEGTLGVVCGATLKLTKPAGQRAVMLFAASGFPAVLELFKRVRAGPFTLGAFEVLTDRCLSEVEAEGNGRSPFKQRAPAYALVELEADREDEALHASLENWLQTPGVDDGVLASSLKQERELWGLRENITESLSHRGFVHKDDVAVPVAKLGEFVSGLEALFTGELKDMEAFVFGHIGDGNLHVNVPRPAEMDAATFDARRDLVDQRLGELLASLSGSVSAEHGIGLLKKDHLAFTRSPDEIALFRSIKAVFDPKGLLNPGKIFDAT